jgi:hypothetical protein
MRAGRRPDGLQRQIESKREISMFMSIARRALVVLAAVLATGCAMQAPRYQPSLDNVETAKKLPAPVGDSYAAYLADALQQELQLAGKVDAKSKVIITGVLLKNDIAAGGFSTNSGQIEAEFVVMNDGKERFRGTQRAELSWDGSFIGAVAIPKAQQQYPLLVQKLLTQLFSDAAFIAALK